MQNSELKNPEFDASCPVNVFANGILALDYIPEITPQILSNSEVASEYLITNLIEDEKNSNLVRGLSNKEGLTQ